MHRVSGRAERVAWGEANGPGQVAGAPVAASVEQAADAPEDGAQGNARRENIGHLPERQLFHAEVENAGQRGANQPAVINQPPAPDREDFAYGPACERFAPIRNDVKSPRPDNRAKDEPRAQVYDVVRGDARPQTAAAGGPQAGDEAQGHQDSIPVYGEWPEIKGDRMHRSEFRIETPNWKMKTQQTSSIARAASSSRFRPGAVGMFRRNVRPNKTDGSTCRPCLSARGDARPTS